MKEKYFNNADSFAMAFDDEWSKVDCKDLNLKIKKVIEILNCHPFVQNNPEMSYQVANFRVNSLGKFK
tara:strand:+ start:315 stop:518 length:204 start_codon:yes stop_codon:yes gene_type:complete